MKASKLQRISCILTLIVFGGELYAQAYYMHEAAEDAGYRNDGISILSIIGLIIFVVLLILFIPLIIRNKIDDYEFNKKYKNRQNILTEEAKRVLNQRFQNKTYLEYCKNNAWRDWFIRGYIDGVGKHIPGLCSTQELLEHNWEAPAKRYIDGVREELVGGNRDMSFSAYKSGYNEGLKRRESRGDIEL